jgi:hypothetical protein
MGVLVNYTEKNLFLGSGNVDKRWGRLEGILKGDYASLLNFIVQLANFYGCPFTIPSNFTMNVTTTGKTVKTLSFIITTEITQMETFTAESLSLNEIGSIDQLAQKNEYEELIDSPVKFIEVCQVRFFNFVIGGVCEYESSGFWAAD